MFTQLDTPLTNLIASPAGLWLIGLCGFLAGLIACGLLAVIEYGAWALVLPPRGRQGQGAVAEPAADAGAISAVAADGARLAGRWSPAIETHGPGHTALLLHGFAESN